MRLGSSLGPALAACAVLSGASAAEAQTRTVVREFSGPGGKALRQSVVKALSRQGAVELVAAEEVDRKAAALGADASSAEGRTAIAQEMGIAAFVEGEVERKGKRSTLAVRVYDGAGGGLAGEATFSGRGAALGRRVQAAFWDELGSAIEGTSAPAKAEPEPEPAPAALVPEDTEKPRRAREEPADEPEPPAGPLPTALGARVAFGGTTRDFSYNDDLPGLRDYCLGPQCDAFGLGPILLLGVAWYPGAHFTDGFASNLGLDLRGLLMFGITSKRKTGGGEFTTNHRALGAGMRLRLPLGDHEAHLVVGYGSHVFELDAAGGMSPDVPGVSYGFLRFGAGARLVVAKPLSLSFAGAYLLPLAYGEIAEDRWFPHTGGGGVEGELAIGYGVADWIDLELGGFFTRFFLSHEPNPSDDSVAVLRRVAGGSLDQYVGLRAGLALRL